MAFTSFALCLIVAALECRSETETVLTTATFDSKQMNWTLLAEFVLAVLVTQMDVFNRLLDTTPITLAQFGWALVPAWSCWSCGSSASSSSGGGRPTRSAGRWSPTRGHVRAAPRRSAPTAPARSRSRRAAADDRGPSRRSATQRDATNPRSSRSGTTWGSRAGGRYWVRTSDLFGVNEALYH